MLLAPRAGRRSGRGPPSGDTMCGLETRGVGTGHERLARRRPQQLAREQISWRPPGTVPCTLIAHGQRQIQRLLRTPLLLRLRGMCLRLDYPCHSSISLLQLTLNRLTALASRSHTELSFRNKTRFRLYPRSVTIGPVGPHRHAVAAPPMSRRCPQGHNKQVSCKRPRLRVEWHRARMCVD